MNRLSVWISGHPVTAFFSITYLISWPLFFLVLAILPQNPAAQGILGSLAVFAPAFAGMLAAGAAEPERASPRPKAKWITFLLTWVAAWATLVFFVVYVREVPLSGFLVALGGILALLPAYTASGAFSSVMGIRRCFQSLVLPRGHVLWYMVALGSFPAIQLAGAGLARLFGTAESELSISVEPATAGLIFLNGFFFAGGINEETGWRGFALPRLQRRYCPLAAALIVWVFWALWHLPADLASGDPVSSILINRLFFNAMWSILFMWVFNRTNGSVLAPALFHPAMNTFGDLLPRTDFATVLFFILVLFAILKDRMWLRLADISNREIPITD